MGTPSNFRDLTGQRFGRFKVLFRSENRNGKVYWRCKCDCGEEKDVLSSNLTTGKIKSCGCYHDECLSYNRIIDLTGKKFGRLTVLKRAKNRGKDVFWLCQCECGNQKEVNGSKLRGGKTKSCGCLKKDMSFDEKYGFVRKTHGMSNTRIYRIYNKMKLRCYSKTNSAYKDYGGRGITVCQEWLDDFMNFYNWSMENGYSDDLSIDRINNDKGYSPENCRWATKKKQANNTRSTVFLTYKGETKPASEWSKITGIRQDTLTMRKRNGWSDDRCIETPVKK